jgi:hypothetical protein
MCGSVESEVGRDCLPRWSSLCVMPAASHSLRAASVGARMLKPATGASGKRKLAARRTCTTRCAKSAPRLGFIERVRKSRGATQSQMTTGGRAQHAAPGEFRAWRRQPAVLAGFERRAGTPVPHAGSRDSSAMGTIPQHICRLPIRQRVGRSPRPRRHRAASRISHRHTTCVPRARQLGRLPIGG